MKPPISRILVFLAALRTHGETGHRGPRAVVGAAGDDRQARPAVRTIQEWIAIAAVGRIEQLGQAGGASCHVGRNQHLAVRVALTGINAELCIAAGRNLGPGNAVNMCQCRRVVREHVEKAVQGAAFPFHLDPHIAGLIPDKPLQVQIRGQIVNEGSETDSLDDAVHADRSTLHHRPPPHSHAMQET